MADEAKRRREIAAWPAADRDAPLSVPVQAPTTATAFAAKATDLEALRNAVVEAASVGAGLWLSYLGVFFYLAIAVGSVTHRDLFFESPVKLPFLNVDLPLKAFFALGPLLFLIMHAYVLLHFLLLAGKVGAFHIELRRQVTDEDTRTRLRRQLPSNIFVQYLAGPREVRTRLVGFMLRLIAWITLVIGPIALLVLFQLQFLPYHHQPITWWHRIAVIIDLALLWLLWPSVARGGTTWKTWRDVCRGELMAAALATLLSVLFVFTIATFPGEWLDNHVPAVPLVPTAWPKTESGEEASSVATLWKSMEWTSVHRLLVAGDVDFTARKPTSLWSNRMVLPQIDAVDREKFDTEAKIEAARATLALRGRHLEGAVMIDADLRKVDFTEAHLQGALFTDAQLRDANLTRAELQGAKLDGTMLRGTSFRHAHLQGAELDDADLRGADLSWAELQGALLDSAKLQGASLSAAYLQGADLSHADLQGTDLSWAELQGARLNGTKLQGATLNHNFVWRADAREANTEGARVTDLETGAKYQGGASDRGEWSANAFAALQGQIELVPRGKFRDGALRRIAILGPAMQVVGEKSMAKRWGELAESPLPDDIYLKTLAGIGCSEGAAPYVARGLITRLSSDERLSKLPAAAALAQTFLDEGRCPGVRGLSEEERATLRKIRDNAASAAQ